MESNDDADADADSILLQIIIIAVLTIINAFFAMSEMAVISANKTKIDILAKDGNKKAKLVQKLNDNQTNFLSTIQVGITLAGFFSSATAAGSIAVLLSDWLITLNVPYAEGIAVVVITLILSFLTLIFGELLPKKIALAFPEKISLNVARIINFVRILTTPIVKVLSGTCNLIVKLIGINKYLVEEKISEEEIISVVEESVEDGTLDVEKQKMIESVLKFNDLTATDIMTPRIKVFMIDIEEPLNEYLNDIFEQKFTRIPVYKETRDNIIGWIHVRDLMQEIIEKGVENVKIDKVMRKALYVRDMMKINKLFQVMKDTKNQIAILLDEFGGVSGIATMEDIVEEVVGNIYDEYDDEKNFIRLNDNQYLVNGDTPVQEVNRDLDLEFDEENSNYDTIGGLILATLDSFPKGGEVLEFDNVELSVQKVKNQKIETIKITINEKVIEDLEEIE
ncbi:MAG: HlyC/CorC family transporter [Bacilli bacterium]|nr:HlyC/CorC family transporter [Bacilli bacterium]